MVFEIMCFIIIWIIHILSHLAVDLLLVLVVVVAVTVAAAAV